ncbi:hypothetical protein MMRN_38880 [Mycobacterium marinum]|uniref:hypothetical protein n=1 Tax=Mycobacterium marinum TaxID=1781 RepID=UPI000CD9411B|nr:hypothetical protein [Mycobacterium marinum]AXN50983.1 hypothetical protein CCUG20998_03581 [Mycobacterium marinum]RFZ25420.1 hypothetical protein DSM43519_01606 [Mycobacterium marinum]RFZ28305.1 hypothetical protein DSM44344_01350 [Mycobacterium marinum]RFZ33867.1 hypothetical protein NCTC2275_02713 [Mycobacterium marinum]WOR03028.1 hypothetical protein QDR78_17605 [Mycobacterium marinum]
MIRPTLLATLSVLAAATLTISRAHANPATDYTTQAAAICQTLDHSPTFGGLIKTIDNTATTTGLDLYTVGGIVANAVIDQCPWHIPLLERFVDTIEPRATTTTGRLV